MFVLPSGSAPNARLSDKPTDISSRIRSSRTLTATLPLPQPLGAPARLLIFAPGDGSNDAVADILTGTEKKKGHGLLGSATVRSCSIAPPLPRPAKKHARRIEGANGTGALVARDTLLAKKCVRRTADGRASSTSLANSCRGAEEGPRCNCSEEN